MDKKEEYLVLLSKTYNEAVDLLLKKYGEAVDDYFSEQSYERFLKGEIKKITKGKYSRSVEGLECHHIDENKFLNMSNESFIKLENIPFKYHKKERLVFCDVIEHTILHALIAKETSLKFGYPGYQVFLSRKIRCWYLDKAIPQKRKWHITCYHKAYIEPEEASELLGKMDSILSAEQKRINQEELEKKKEIFRKGNFKNLTSNSPRRELVGALYELNKMGASGYLHVFNRFPYSEEYKKRILQPVEFEEFEREMEQYELSGIVRNIQLYIDYVEGGINHKEYLFQVELCSKTKDELEAERRDKEEREKQEKLKKEAFYSIYPKFEEMGIAYDVKRQEVNRLLFKKCDKYASFIKFQSAMKSYSIDELLERLHLIVKE